MTTEQKTEQKLDEVLNLLNRVNNTFTYPIYISSLEKDVFFKEINTAQQKRIVKCLINSPDDNAEFIRTMKDIIYENCVDDIDKSKLTIIDKFIILLTMRSISIDDLLKMQFTFDEKPYHRGISISKLLEKVKTMKIPCEKTMEYKNFKITCGIPTINTEYKFESQVKENLKNVKTKEDIKENLTLLYSEEMLKYIKILSIIEEDKETIIDFEDLDLNSCLSIFNTLPLSIYKQVQEYIKEIKTEFNKIKLIEIEIEENTKKKVRLDLTPSFFINF